MIFTDIEYKCPIKSLIAFHWLKHDLLNVIVILYIIKVVCRCLAMLDKSVLFLFRVACTRADLITGMGHRVPPLKTGLLFKKQPMIMCSEVEE